MTRAARYAALVLTAVFLQAGVFPYLQLFGVVPDLGLVVAAAVAFRRGPEVGAVTAFVAGLGTDLYLETPLGLTALAWALAAYGVGVVQTGMLRAPRWSIPALGGGAGLTAGLAFLGIGIVSGVDVLRTWDALWVVVRVALYDALLAPVVFPLVSRVVAPADRIRSVRR